MAEEEFFVHGLLIIPSIFDPIGRDMSANRRADLLVPVLATLYH